MAQAHVLQAPRSAGCGFNSGTPNPGIAYEWQCDLCNRLGKDLWLTVPVKATDAYFASLAALIKQRLAPGLKIYLEFSNENWNGGFAQFNYCIAQGAAMPSNFTSLFGDQWRRGQGWAVWRSIKLWEAFKAEFGATEFANRCKRVYAYSGDFNIGTVAMSTIFNNATYNPNTHKPDCIAFAPYFAVGFNGSTATQSQIRSDINAVLADSTTPFTDAATYTADVVCYEGGQSCYTNASAMQGQSWLKGEYIYYLDQLKAMGVKLFSHYCHMGLWSSNAGWGAKSTTASTIAQSPKYDALLTWVANN